MRKKTILAISIIVLIILGLRLCLPLPAKFLLVKDDIQKADCIFPLGGDIYYRFRKAAELYRQGFAENIVVSMLPDLEGMSRDQRNCAFTMKVYGIEGASQKEFFLSAFRYLGKDASGILFIDQQVTSTYEEALAAKEFFLKQGLKSLILVTTGYHSRRVLMLFSTVFRGSGVKIYICTADRESLIPDRWWTKESEVKDIALEYLSIMHNVIYHFILGKKRTSFDTL